MSWGRTGLSPERPLRTPTLSPPKNTHKIYKNTKKIIKSRNHKKTNKTHKMKNSSKLTMFSANADGLNKKVHSLKDQRKTKI